MCYDFGTVRVREEARIPEPLEAVATVTAPAVVAAAAAVTVASAPAVVI